MPDDRFTILCECGRRECFDLIELTLAEYEDLRRDPNRFAVAPGHQIHAIERTIEIGDRYSIVAKFHPEPIEIAEARDPRSAA